MFRKIKNLALKIFLILFGFYAVFNIAMSNAMLESCMDLPLIERIHYAFLLSLSIFYLHIGAQAFLIPLCGLDKKSRNEILRKASQKVTKGLMAIGYYFVFAYLVSFLGNDARLVECVDDNIHIGLFLIGLGILEKTRAVVKVLLKKAYENRP